MTNAIEKLPPLIGLAKLMALAFAGEDLSPLGAELIQRAETETGGNALMDLATALILRGNTELGLQMQAEAIRSQQVYALPTATHATALQVLAVMGPGDLMANSPIEFLLEHSNIQLNAIYITPTQPMPDELPAHDLLYIAIAQSDANMPLLDTLATTIANWPRPVVNQPARIAVLSRDQVPELLKNIPGIVMPSTVRIDKQTLASYPPDKMPAYPAIIRPVDSHAGHDLERLTDTSALENYLRIHANTDEFYLSAFIDYRNQDGQFRKYRIVLIAGKPYLCHLAISAHWMIHYLNAGMADSAEKRAEEAQVMADFDTGFAARHAKALEAMYQRIGLDYVGLDCAETQDGKLLIFEVDSCMIVHALDPIDLFPYKKPHMHKLFAAFQQMLFDKAA